MPALSWKKLPVLTKTKDVVSVELTPKEIQTISEYCDKMFDKATIDRLPSQWAASKGLNKRNPNTTGIKGEWAALKYLHSGVTLKDFLADRPWKMADMGDALIGSRVFDYKTRTRTTSLEELLEGERSDTWMAEMDNKFANLDKYGYLQAFVFCVNREQEGRIDLMGWIPATNFFKYSQLVPHGKPIPNFWGYYNADTRLIPYNRLRPMADLEGYDYMPISQTMTIMMRDDWNKNKYNPQRYVQSL